MLMWKIVMIPKLMWQALIRVNKRSKVSVLQYIQIQIWYFWELWMLDDPRGFVLFYLEIWICILFVWMMRKYWKEVHFFYIQFMYFGDLVYFLKGFLNYLIYWSAIIEIT